MSRKKGLSLDEKRKIILSIYHDQKVAFNLKEIESIASRMGVVQQTIKDVNQGLVDDALVFTDKIGSANFYWSFPSKAFEDKQQQMLLLSGQKDVITGKNQRLNEEIQALKRQRIAADRKSKLDRLSELIEEEKSLDKELEKSKHLDPQVTENIRNQLQKNIEGVNRWTDNTWVIKKYLTKKKNVMGKDADKLLRIDPSFDYL